MKTVLALTCLAMLGLRAQPLVAQTSGAEARPVAFSRLDTNKDGKISLSEAKAEPDLYASFDMLDLNHDGFLSPAEFQAWPRAQRNTTAAAPDPTTVPGGSNGAQHMPPPPG